MGTEGHTARALIEATIESIHRLGLVGTTVTTVTDLAGVSRGMVRHEFTSKQAMLVCVMESLCAEWTAATEPDPGASGSEQVEAIVRAMFAEDVFTDARVDAWLALSIAATADVALRPIRERAHALWRSQLRAAFDKSGVQDAVVAADGVLAAADGLWLRHRLEPAAMVREHAQMTALAIARAVLDTGVRPPSD